MKSLSLEQEHQECEKQLFKDDELQELNCEQLIEVIRILEKNYFERLENNRRLENLLVRYHIDHKEGKKWKN